VLAQEDWDIVRFPAIAEADETHVIDTLAGPRIFTPCTRRASRWRCPNGSAPPSASKAPAPLGGGMVKAAWFRHYTQDESPATFERIVQSWDTASKATELSDFSVCTSWGIVGRELYLLDVLRRRMEYPELKRAVREQYARFRPSVVPIEDKASGTQLIQELVADGLHAVTRYQPRQDKVMRMHAQTAMIENGFVHVPKTAPWLGAYLHELPVFPNGRHDDQVDSTAQLLDWFKRSSAPSSGADIWELHRQRAEGLRSREVAASRPVRLRAPRGVGAVRLLSGARRNVAGDGTVEVSQSDAAPLLLAGWLYADPGG
jgi:predicted phage terminase large subunit-like protein